jgi:hypothetical protein
VLPETLLDRLLSHYDLGFSETPDIDGRGDIGPDEMQSLEHMFYASAVIAVYQLIQVRTRKISNHDVAMLNNALFVQCLDELLAITRRLCGGVPIRGFEKWILEHKHKSRRGAGTVIPITASRIDSVAEQEIFIVGDKSEEEVV